jgi:putative hydrolase of the HAD superfamily
MRLVVFDATGTLLEVATPIGHVYAECAREAGATLDASAIERGFRAAMAAAAPLAFGNLGPAALETAERSWWRTVARRALESARAGTDFDFERFFDLAWLRFAGAASWRVYPDVRPALRALRTRGFPLAVFSNWDHRLPPLLDELGLGGFFTRVFFSSALSAAKPSRAAFDAVLEAVERHLPSRGERPIMIGDRIDHDVAPALASGWEAIWLDRNGNDTSAPAGARRVPILTELPELLAVLGTAQPSP